MCQACLALAARRSGASGWPLADGETPAPAPGRFTAAEWADAPEEGDPQDAGPAERPAPPVDAPRG